MKAIIIGGGIGGLCSAIALQQAGINVAVYEQADSPRAAGAGLTLWPNAVRALRRLDATDAIATQHAQLRGGIHRRDGLTLAVLDRARLAQRYGAPTVAVHRADFMQALTARAGPVVHYGTRLLRYEQDESGITALFADGSTASADLLVGADGIHSTVREQLQPASRPIYRGYPAWRGVVAFDHARFGVLWGESWGRGARFGSVPLSDERVYWFATVNRPANLPPANHKTFLHSVFGAWHQPIGDLIAATPPEAILYNDIADLEPLPSWIDGRAVLLGDAAHAMTPNMGQGACQAIEDAVVLAQALRDRQPLATALADYQERRLAHTSKVMLRSRTIGRIGQIGNPLLVQVRDAALQLTPGWANLRQLDFVLRGTV